MKHLNPERKRLGFRIHAVAFVVVMLLLVAINLLTGPPYWVQWVLPWWSIGLLSHWWFVLGPGAPGRRRADGLTSNSRQQPQKEQQSQ